MFRLFDLISSLFSLNFLCFSLETRPTFSRAVWRQGAIIMSATWHFQLMYLNIWKCLPNALLWLSLPPFLSFSLFLSLAFDFSLCHSLSLTHSLNLYVVHANFTTFTPRTMMKNNPMPGVTINPARDSTQTDHKSVFHSWAVPLNVWHISVAPSSGLLGTQCEVDLFWRPSRERLIISPS